MISIREVSDKKGLKTFVKFPFSIYKNNPYWVPPIISEEVKSFDPSLNPVFEHAQAFFLLAYHNNKVVGRVVAIINEKEVNEQGIRKMRFGWMDFIDDLDVSKALFDKVIEIGKENDLDFVEGPVGFSNLDKVGLMTEGFDHLSTMISWYNHSYYLRHYTNYGFEPDKRLIDTHFFLRNIEIQKYQRFAKLVKERYELKALNFTSSEQIMPYVDEMFDLFNKSYAKLSTFVPISQKQITYYKEKFISFINPEFIKFVVDKDGKLVTFSVTMPSFAEALQKANGKLFPFGFYHLLKAKKSPVGAVFFLIGVAPEYQKKGVTAIVFEEFYRTFDELGLQKMVITPELEDNKDIQLIWRNFKPVTHARRATMRMDLT